MLNMKLMKRILPTILGPIVALIALECFAAEPKTIETFGVYQLAEFIDNDTLVNTVKNQKNSTHTITGVLQSWNIKAVGGTATFFVQHSTEIGAGYNLVTSSDITVFAADPLSSDLRGYVINPIFAVNSLPAGASLYIRLEYLGPKNPR